MASMTYGFIFVAPGLNGEETIIERDDFRSILVGVSSPADGPAAAVPKLNEQAKTKTSDQRRCGVD